MQPVVLLTFVVACAYAQVYRLPGYDEKDPKFFFMLGQGRLTWGKPLGNGRVFGEIGQSGQNLLGKAGYQQQIFNDHRGKVDAQAYGSRVLGPAGDSSNFGGKVDWSNKNAQASVDLSKQIGGRTTMTATGEGVWNVAKNTQVSAGGTVVQEIGGGRPDVAVQAQIQHDF